MTVAISSMPVADLRAVLLDGAIYREEFNPGVQSRTGRASRADTQGLRKAPFPHTLVANVAGRGSAE